MVRSLVLLTLCLPLVSCISTKTNSFVDPAESDFRPQRILVMAAVGLEHRSYFEDQFATRLKKLGIQAERGIDVFVPTRQYSHEDMRAVVADREFDALLSVVVGEHHAEVVTVGALVTAQPGNGAAVVPMNGLFSTSTTTVRLTNLTTERHAYISQNRTDAEGFLYTGAENTMKDVAAATVKDMQKKGLLPVNSK